MKRGGIFLVILLFPLLSCAGEKEKEGAAPPKPLLALSILPQKYFAARIAGDRAETLVLVEAGADPHTYEAAPRQLAALARAGAWILSGAEFETALRPKMEALFPSLRVIDGAEGVRFRRIEGGHPGEAPASGPEIDRHTWLGREPAKIMARHILDALCALDRANAPAYRENCGALLEEIDSLFESLEGELAPFRGKTVFVYHPAFGYFLDEFGLVQEAVETGGREPTPRALERLIGKARDEGVKVIFAQAQFPALPAETAAKVIGGRVALLDPLAEDWPGNIRAMGEALKAGMQNE